MSNHIAALIFRIDFSTRIFVQRPLLPRLVAAAAPARAMATQMPIEVEHRPSWATASFTKLSRI